MIYYVNEKNQVGTLIGKIEFNSIIDEAKINTDDSYLNLDGPGACNVYVFAKEGANEHFHIKSTNGKFETCVRIYSAQFFCHDDMKHKALSKGNCELLDKWLRLPNYKNPKKSNWQVIKDEWKKNNPDSKYKKPPKEVFEQPDYTKMEKPDGSWKVV